MTIKEFKKLLRKMPKDGEVQMHWRGSIGYEHGMVKEELRLKVRQDGQKIVMLEGESDVILPKG